MPLGAIAGSVGGMKQILVVVAVVLLLGAMGWSIRSCSQRASGGQGLATGVEAVFRCRACKHEFQLPPKAIAAAYQAGEVRGSGTGVDLFKCARCGKLEAMQELKGEP